MAYQVKRFGWLPDLPDIRDHRYSAPLAALTKLPGNVDLTAKCPPVYDQGQLGSCTANAIAGAIEFMQLKEHQKEFTPSRLFIYYNERVIEHSVPFDAGAYIRDGIKSVQKQGVCREKPTWPYVESKFDDKPSPAAYAEAADHKVLAYQRISRDLQQMKGCLASGYPFVFGFTVYSSFMSDAVDKTGHAPMPGTDETIEGGHAVLAVGYDDAHHRFICRNSWSPAWGMKGYFTLPYAYLLDANLSDDFWSIRLV
jgi:C1A family cysteine protease